ncbi:MAG: hypothetical protein AB7I48_06720 [Planctomycetaceae bacterium]
MVECDGGRIRTREPGHGPGGHRRGEGWRETKAAGLQSARLDTFDSDPRQIVATSLGYLKHNAPRMNSPDYRRRGLPVTTAWMESLVKQINSRVKGTEMFWNDPHGAEAILQIRAAALSEDDRLNSHPQTRPGSPFTRRHTSAKLTTQKNNC